MINPDFHENELFNTGDDVSSPEFRHKLNLLFRLATTPISAAAGSNIVVDQDPGVGVTIGTAEEPPRPVGFFLRFPATVKAVRLWPRHTARWVYEFEKILLKNKDELDFDGTQGLNNLAGGNTATNLLELAHAPEPKSKEPEPSYILPSSTSESGEDTSPWLVWGVNVHGPDYPEGFSPKPVGGAMGVSVPVIIETYQGINEIIHVFSAVGSHDGTCLPEEEKEEEETATRSPFKTSRKNWV